MRKKPDDLSIFLEGKTHTEILNEKIMPFNVTQRVLVFHPFSTWVSFATKDYIFNPPSLRARGWYF